MQGMRLNIISGFLLISKRILLLSVSSFLVHSHSCFSFQEELSSLLNKVKDVISENENLHERQKSKLIKSVFDHLETETETETEAENKSVSDGAEMLIFSVFYYLSKVSFGDSMKQFSIYRHL